jgi:hypothetical protein
MNSIIDRLREKELFDQLSNIESFSKLYTIYNSQFGYYYRRSFFSYNKMHNSEYVSCVEVCFTKQIIYNSLFEDYEDAVETISLFRKKHLFVVNCTETLKPYSNFKMETMLLEVNVCSVATIPY